MTSSTRVLVFLVFVSLLCILPSCVQQPTDLAGTSSLNSTGSLTSLQKVTVYENFESGTKTAYAVANVTLSTGVWNLDEALLGTTTSDRKVGLQSVRTRYSGKITMMFDRTDGASTVSVMHALYGTDASCTWQMWYSTNGGSTWTQIGSTVTTSSTTLKTASFTVNKAGTIRFQIRKTDGTANRINFDEFILNDYTTTTSTSEHTVLGNPSNAIADVNLPTNYLMEKPQYVLSYHRDHGTPNWVAWHLSTSWLGTAPRQDDFRADSTLPSTWYHVLGTSYTNSGYDRGHMCPSADRTITIPDNSATFLMTNMIPQSPNNNQGPWAVLEDSCRLLVTTKGCELYIYSGGYGSQATIDNGHVTVPSYTWKVIVVIANGDNDLTRVTTSTRVIAVWMPNSDALISRTANWKSYRVSVDYIESQTGYDFLSNVSSSIQSVIESKVDAI